MKFTRLIAPGFFALLSLIIVFPLMLPGYILTLDNVPTPNVSLLSFSSSSFFMGAVRYLFSLFLPAYVFPKIMLFLAFFLAGFGMFSLTYKKNIFAGLLSGLIYSINPFVYERVMAGQWSLLLAYSLFPFFILALIGFFSHPSLKNAVFLGVIMGLIVQVYLHYSLIVAAAFVIFAILKLIFSKTKYILLLKNILAVALIALLININWLLPSLFGQSQVSQTLSTFSERDLIAFQSVEDGNYGLIFNLLSGYGFWGEVYDYFLSPKQIIPVWPLLSVLLISLSAFGFVKALRTGGKSDYPLIFTFIILALIGLDLSGGIALKPASNFIFSLYRNFPLLRGFREPQKLVSLIFLSYAFFAPVGLQFLINSLKYKKVNILLWLTAMAVPFISTPVVFGGFWGQLKPVFYPTSWYKVNSILEADNDNFLVLFFPWHQYMRFNFNNNLVVANPAPFFFNKPILSSRNYETRYLFSHDTRPEALHIEGLLSIEEKKENLLGEKVDYRVDWPVDLSVINVKYIILAKDSDWKRYRFLENFPGLEKVHDDFDVILFRNLSFGKEIVPYQQPLPEELVTPSVSPPFKPGLSSAL